MKILYYLIYTVISSVLVSGCSKQLDLQPTDNINENNVYRTIKDAQLGANGAYKFCRALYRDVYVSALLSDEAKLGAGNLGQGAVTYRYQFTSESGDVQAGYAEYYTMIDQVNRVLRALPNVVASAGEENRRKALQGQLLALRAIGHFHLLQSFCKNYDAAGKGVPIMLVPDPSARPNHNTMGEVMGRIETDMAEAYSILTAINATAFSDTVMNVWNIDAYRARIALYKGDYENAIVYAGKVINAGVCPLVSGTTFDRIWTEAGYPYTTIPETLFRIVSDAEGSPGNIWLTGAGTVSIAPSDKLTSMYESNDRRLNAYIGTINGNPYIKKHVSERPGNADKRLVDLKVIRIAEMYLIRAEAYAKAASPNITAGIADLKMLRDQRFTGLAPALPTITSVPDLLAAVMLERYRELCFEGSRFFDLKRNNLPVNRFASDVTAATWQNLPAGDHFFVMPIPFAEILANPNAVQNTGY